MYLCVHCLFPCKHACGHMYMCVHCIFLCKHALWCMYVCVHFIFPCMHACCCMNLSLAIGDIHSLNYKPYKIWIPHKIVVIALKFKPSVFTGNLFYSTIILNDADNIANSVDLHQTRCRQIWMPCTAYPVLTFIRLGAGCTFYPDLFV